MQPSNSASDDPLSGLRDWLAQHWPQARNLRCLFEGKPKTGMSNDTRFVLVEREEAGGVRRQKFVLRRATSEQPIHPLQTGEVETSVELQHRVMSSLVNGSTLPVARVLPLELDSKWLGGAFFLMEFIEGWVPPDFPSFTETGPITDAGPTERDRFIHNGLAALAQIHHVDWRAAGLQWLDRRQDNGPCMPAQLDLWESYCAPIFKQTNFPVLGETLAWLRAHLPDEPEPALTWGDARPQNMLWSKDFDVLAIMDWEGAAILPPEVDIAYWLVNDSMVHERVMVERLPGYPSRGEQLDIYTRRLGRPVRDTEYYKIFARMTIVATMYNVYRILQEAGVDAGPDSDPTANYFARDLQRALGSFA